VTLGEHHDRAQKLAAQAMLMAAQGDDRAAALRLYAEAAALEREAFLQVPADKARTRGILAVSFVSMLYKARELKQAESALYGLLAQDTFTAPARAQLRELLEVVWDEQAIAENGRQYADDDLVVALRGGEIGAGTAPLDLVLQKGDGFRSLLTRAAEWLGGYDFRARGRPPAEITDALQLRALQPAPGSYLLTVRLTEPIQASLFEDEAPPAVQSAAVSSSVMQMMRLLSTGTEEEVAELVPQENYRVAFTRLIRNIVPSKKDAEEVEVRRMSGGETAEKVCLMRGTRTRINDILRAKGDDEDTTAAELRGVLRALHLDKNWVEIALPDGEHQRCETPPETLDEVVGPMVNRSVVVFGRWSRPRGRKGKFHLKEIDLDEDSMD